MAEPRNEFERRAETAQRARGRGRSVSHWPPASRLLLALALAALAVGLAQLVDAVGGGIVLRSLLFGGAIGAAVMVATGHKRG